MNSEKKMAVERGWTQYEGKPCARCGGVLRYTSNSNCCVCHGYKSRLTWQERAAKIAGVEARRVGIEKGDKRYHGVACKKCGGTERFTANTGCVVCTTSAAVRSQEAARARFHSDTSVLLWLNEPPAQVYAELYAMCPEVPPGWRVVYSDLGVPGLRTFTGADVFARPEALVHLANEYQRGERADHHESARRLVPAIMAAMRAYNEKLRHRSLDA